MLFCAGCSESNVNLNVSEDAVIREYPVDNVLSLKSITQDLPNVKQSEMEKKENLLEGNGMILRIANGLNYLRFLIQQI